MWIEDSARNAVGQGGLANPLGSADQPGVVKAAAARGWLDERTAALESLTAIRRAGADVIVSYWTKELAAWL